MSGITLYEAADDMRALMDTQDGLAGEELQRFNLEVRPLIERALTKVDDFSRFLAHVESQIELARKEEQRIAEWRQQKERRLSWLKDYAIAVMTEQGLKKLEGETTRLSLRAKPASVEITDAKAIPDEFIIVKTERSIDKRKIKDTLAAGGEVPGADLAIGGHSLVRS